MYSRSKAATMATKHFTEAKVANIVYMLRTHWDDCVKNFHPRLTDYWEYFTHEKFSAPNVCKQQMTPLFTFAAPGTVWRL